MKVCIRSYRVAPAERAEELIKSTEILQVIFGLVSGVSNA